MLPISSCVRPSPEIRSVTLCAKALAVATVCLPCVGLFVIYSVIIDPDLMIGVDTMGVEFRLGHGDHKVVEDFLTHHPAGVAAVVLDPKAARHQEHAAEAAIEAGVEVYFDPATERLTGPGFDMPSLNYARNGLYDTVVLASDPRARAQLTEQVAQAHPSTVTRLTPPHFYVADTATARLNLDLAERMTHDHGSKPVRPVLLLSSRLPLDVVRLIADDYAAAGFRDLEVRVTPLGGEEESARKILRAFGFLAAFTGNGIAVTLGRSGNVGQVAVALGHAAHFSVGIGMLERVNHAAQMTRQKAPPPEGGTGGGPQSGIYLPGIAYTAPPKVGKALLENTDLRTRVSCRIGICGSSVRGPLADPRAHYLHSRAHEAAALEERPPTWRATMETDRLRRALELRGLINRAYLPEDAPVLKTRTLSSLIDDIESERAGKTA